MDLLNIHSASADRVQEPSSSLWLPVYLHQHSSNQPLATPPLSNSSNYTQAIKSEQMSPAPADTIIVAQLLPMTPKDDRAVHVKAETPSPKVEPLTPTHTPPPTSHSIKQEPSTLPTPPSSVISSSPAPVIPPNVARVTALEQQLSVLKYQFDEAQNDFDNQQIAYSHLTIERDHLRNSLQDANELREKLLKQRKDIERQVKENLKDVRRLKDEHEAKGEEVKAQKVVKREAAIRADNLRGEKGELEEVMADAVYERDLEASFPDGSVRKMARQMGWGKEDGDFDTASFMEQEAWVGVASRLASGAKDIDFEDFGLIEDGVRRTTAERSMGPGAGKGEIAEHASCNVCDDSSGSEDGAGLTFGKVQSALRDLRAAEEKARRMMRIMKGTKRKRSTPAEAADGHEEQLLSSARRKSRRLTSAGTGHQRIKASAVSLTSPQGRGNRTQSWCHSYGMPSDWEEMDEIKQSPGESGENDAEDTGNENAEKDEDEESAVDDCEEEDREE